MPNGDKRFTAEEVAEIIADDVQTMVSNLGSFDPGDPEQVYKDVSRIMEKLSEGTAERARDVAKKRSG